MLKEVRTKAAQQRSILEKGLEKSGHSIQPARAEESAENSSRDVEPASAALLERQQEKAQSVRVLSAVQVHIANLL